LIPFFPCIPASLPPAGVHGGKKYKMTNEKTQVLDVIESAGLEQDTTRTLRQKFMPFWEQAEKWRETAAGLVVTDASQTREMKMAREARLALREIRINADKTRKALKEDSIRYGRAVQGVYNVIEYLIKPIEEHLLEQEKFAEIQAQRRLEALNAERERIAAPLVAWIDVDLPFTNTPWANFDEAKFQEIISAAQAAKEAEAEEAARLEAERIAREKAEEEERQRILEENARLRAEAEERERKAAAERAELEAQRRAAEEEARKERAERERIEADARRKAEADEAERRKAAAAPDKEKLLAFAAELQAIDLPQVSNAQAMGIRRRAERRIIKTACWIREQADKI